MRHAMFLLAAHEVGDVVIEQGEEGGALVVGLYGVVGVRAWGRWLVVTAVVTQTVQHGCVGCGGDFPLFEVPLLAMSADHSALQRRKVC